MTAPMRILLLVFLVLAVPAAILAQEPADEKQTVTFTVEGRVGYLASHDQQFVPSQYLPIHVVSDEQIIFPDGYGLGESSSDGSFSIQCQADIDYSFHILILTRNPAAKVLNAASQWGNSFSFTIGSWALPTDGSTIHVGTLMPEDPEIFKAMEIAETIYRGRWMYQNDLGVSIPRVEMLFPDTFGSATEPYYFELLDKVVVPNYQDLREDQLLGAYAIQYQALSGMHYHVFPDYCNGNCDPDVGQSHCGSCLWCEEDVEVTWREGWALFLSRLATEYIEDNYPATGLEHQPIDDIVDGQETFCALGGGPTPGIIPGYFAAAMWDLADGDDFGENNDINPGFQDVAQGLAADLVAGALTPCGSLGRLAQTPEELLHCLMDARPDVSAEIWETCALNGFQLDDTAPGAPTFTAHSPPVNVSTPASAIWLDWDPPVDEMSGIAGYSYLITTASPAMPGTTTNLDPVDSHLFTGLAPGTRYISLRAVDQAGNWSDQWAWKGPFVLTIPDPVDLQPQALTGWEYPLVPRGTPDAAFGDAQVSNILPSHEASTYLSYGARNTGNQNADATVTALYVDSDTLLTDNLGTLGAGMTSAELNLGPLAVTGGRHIMGVHLDSDHAVNESEENDNFWAGQWAWVPETLGYETVYTRPAPPGMTAGFEFMSFEMPFSGNCSGHRIGDDLLYQGVFLYPADQTADYDLKLFEADNWAESGFLTPLAHSGRPGGCLEGIVVFGLNAGIGEEWNVGAVNMDYDQGAWADSDYLVRPVQGTTLTEFGPYASNLNVARMLEVFTVTVPSGSNGHVTFTLEPQDELPMHLAFFDQNFAMGSLLDASVIATADMGQPASISVYAPPGSYCGLAVWRDLIGDLFVPRNFFLTYASALPDPATNVPEGWLSCLVPHEDNYQDVGNLTMPTWLPGNGSPTTLYYAEINHGLVGCPQHTVQIRLDGEEYDEVGHDNSMDPGEEHRGNIDEGHVFPGGRHTLTMRLDPEGNLNQETNANDMNGRQWVWEPTLIGIGSTNTFPAPNFMIGGWDEATSGTSFFFNQLGFTNDDALEPAWGRFAVISLATPSSADIDLRMYEVSTGPDDGFDYPIITSMVGLQCTEIIIIDLEATGNISRDFGISNWTGGDGTGALSLDITGGAMPYTVGQHGPYPLAANNVHTAWEFHLPPGLWPITMSTEATSVDLGFAVFPEGQENYRRLDAPEGAIAWAKPAGADEEILVRVDESGQDQCLVIWRRGVEFLDQAVQYTITIGGDVTAVDDYGSVPVTTNLLAPAPNPFNPRTMIAFDLAAPGSVGLRIFDMAGRLVRTLVNGEQMAAGRHELTWQGRDDQGRLVATGPYFCRLRTGDTVQVKRMMLLK